MEGSSTVNNSMKVNKEDSTQKIMEILEKGDGKTFEEKKAEAFQYIQTQTDTALAEILLRVATEDEIGSRWKKKFWEHGETIRAADAIVLRDVKANDKEYFLKVQSQYFEIKFMIENNSCRELLWKEHISCKSLMCSIENDGIYVGYCGIKNLACEEWEIAIEILEDWTDQGIGYVAVRALVNEIKNRLGVTEFRVRIDPQNYVSQKFFEKLGAVPNGISKLVLYREEDIESCGENKNSIDSRLAETAKKFEVEPEQLSDYVLEYKMKI